MLPICSEPSTVTLRGGFVALLPAVDLILDLEARGFEVARAGDKIRVRPADRLTANDTAAIRRHRDTLLALVDYCEGANTV